MKKYVAWICSMFVVGGMFFWWEVFAAVWDPCSTHWVCASSPSTPICVVGDPSDTEWDCFGKQSGECTKNSDCTVSWQTCVWYNANQRATTTQRTWVWVCQSSTNSCASPDPQNTATKFPWNPTTPNQARVSWTTGSCRFTCNTNFTASGQTCVANSWWWWNTVCTTVGSESECPSGQACTELESYAGGGKVCKPIPQCGILSYDHSNETIQTFAKTWWYNTPPNTGDIAIACIDSYHHYLFNDPNGNYPEPWWTDTYKCKYILASLNTANPVAECTARRHACDSPSDCTASWATCADINADGIKTCNWWVVTNPVDWVCGWAAKTYAATDPQSFDGDLCSAWSAPSSPNFPSPGNSITWICEWVDGWNDTNPPCEAIVEEAAWWDDGGDDWWDSWNTNSCGTLHGANKLYFQYQFGEFTSWLCNGPAVTNKNVNTSTMEITRTCGTSSCNAWLLSPIEAICKSFGTAWTSDAPSNSSSDPLCTAPSAPSWFQGQLPWPSFSWPVGWGWASTNPWIWTCEGNPIDNPYSQDKSCTAPSAWECSPNFHEKEFYKDNEPWANNNATCANWVQQNYNEWTDERTRDCMWSSWTQPASCRATKNNFSTSGVCGDANGGSFYQAEITAQTLCESGTPDPSSLWQATSNKRTRKCLRDGDGQTEAWGDAQDSPNCTATLKADGVCQSFGSSEYNAIPSNLCQVTNTTPNVGVNASLWRRERTCSWLNGWTDDGWCFAKCLWWDCWWWWGSTAVCGNNVCETGETTANCPADCTASPICGNGVCEAGESEASCSADCTNSGPVCGNDLQTKVEIWTTCNDCDGCLCGSNQILNWSVCSTVLPLDPDAKKWDADLMITMTPSIIKAKRRGDLSFTLTYKNLWPDTATGTKVLFTRSDLFEDIESETVFTLSWWKLIFDVWHLKKDTWWSITINGKVKPSFLQSDIIATAQITNDYVEDANTLNNTKTVKVPVDWELYELDFGIINPIPPLYDTYKQYNMLIQRHGSDDLIFRDVIPWHPWYMHIQTVVRNGIMKWYQYKFSRLFSPKKCLTRSELLIVAGRIMHMSWESGVYDSDLRETPYTDVGGNLTLAKYINRAYKYGVTEPFDNDLYDYNTKLFPNKDALQWEAKAVLEKLYRIMKIDTLILKPLFPQEELCVTRWYMAYAITHILRWNENIVMWLNDQFIKEMINRLWPYTIADRRKIVLIISRLIDNLAVWRLYRMWLDGETLSWVLRASLRWETYISPWWNAGTASFFDAINQDQYSAYARGMYMTQYQAWSDGN